MLNEKFLAAAAIKEEQATVADLLELFVRPTPESVTIQDVSTIVLGITPIFPRYSDSGTAAAINAAAKDFYNALVTALSNRNETLNTAFDNL